MVSAESSTVSAISLGVFCRLALSTRAIMRSSSDWPDSTVTSTTMLSVSSLVPALTPLLSVPASRSTGADSPVTADSLMLAAPSTISPSAGISSPASTRTRSPRRSARGGYLLFAVPREAPGHQLLAGGAQALGLGPTPRLRQRLGGVGKEHGKQQDEGDGEVETPGAAGGDIGAGQPQGHQRADADHKHHRVVRQPARIEPPHRLARQTGEGGGVQ